MAVKMERDSDIKTYNLLVWNVDLLQLTLRLCSFYALLQVTTKQYAGDY